MHQKTPRLRISRPQTARAVARRSWSAAAFGLNLRDWFHELQLLSTRAQLLAAMKTRPQRLAAVFPQGEIADAFLAAQVEWFCHRAGVRSPRWSRDPSYALDLPWFSLPGRRVRAHLLLDTPDEFRNRNLFTTPEENIIKIRPGRPRVDDLVKREKSRLRQKRYRARVKQRTQVA